MGERKRPKYMLSTTDPHQNKRYTQTKSKRMEKGNGNFFKWKFLKSWDSNIYIRQNGL